VLLLLLAAAVPACLPAPFAPPWLHRAGGTAGGKDVAGTPTRGTSPRRGSRVGGIRGGSPPPLEEDGGGGGGRRLEEDPQRKLVSGGTPVPRGEYPFLAVVRSNSVWSKETNSSYLLRFRI
jgi:hypothetical protein